MTQERPRDALKKKPTHQRKAKVKNMNMELPMPLNQPRLGQALSDELSYVRRASAEKQAKFWNQVLADNPIYGPASGLIVGAAPKKDADGRYKLVWAAPKPIELALESGPTERLFSPDGNHRSRATSKAFEDQPLNENGEPMNRADRRRMQRGRRRGNQ